MPNERRSIRSLNYCAEILYNKFKDLASVLPDLFQFSSDLKKTDLVQLLPCAIAEINQKNVKTFTGRSVLRKRNTPISAKRRWQISMVETLLASLKKLFMSCWREHQIVILILDDIIMMIIILIFDNMIRSKHIRNSCHNAGHRSHSKNLRK